MWTRLAGVQAQVLRDRDRVNGEGVCEPGARLRTVGNRLVVRLRSACGHE